MKLTIVSLLFLACALSATVLSDAVASMSAGQWKELTGTLGFDNGGIMVPLDQGCGTGDYVTQYAEKAAWDPVNKRFLFYGATHGYCYAQRLIIYTDATNTWTEGPRYAGSCSGSSGCFSHAYDHNTVNPLTGDFYYREYGGVIIYKFSATNNSWSNVTTVPTSVVRLQGTCCNAIEWFPDRNGLVVSGGNGNGSELGFYSAASGSWTQIANQLSVGDYNNFAKYDPVHKVVLFGGGGSYSTSVYKLGATGAPVRMGNAPIGLGPTFSVLSLDPVSGRYLVLSGSGHRQYDVPTDTWSAWSTTAPSEPMLFSTEISDFLLRAD